MLVLGFVCADCELGYGRTPDKYSRGAYIRYVWTLFCQLTAQKLNEEKQKRQENKETNNYETKQTKKLQTTTEKFLSNTTIQTLIHEVS